MSSSKYIYGCTVTKKVEEHWPKDKQGFIEKVFDCFGRDLRRF